MQRSLVIYTLKPQFGQKTLSAWILLPQLIQFFIVIVLTEFWILRFKDLFIDGLVLL